MKNFSLVQTLSAAVLTAALPAHAITYELDQFPFTFMGATSVSATLTTSQTGTFAGTSEIASFLNGSLYSAALVGPSGSLTTLNNSNSSWSLLQSGLGTNATLVATPTNLRFIFDTPSEFSGIGAVLKSSDNRSVLQFRQENNVTDSAFVNFSFDAMFMANYSAAYGQSFTAPALPVSEPPIQLLAVLGLGALALRRYRRNA